MLKQLATICLRLPISLRNLYSEAVFQCCWLKDRKNSSQLSSLTLRTFLATPRCKADRSETPWRPCASTRVRPGWPRHPKATLQLGFGEARCPEIKGARCTFCEISHPVLGCCENSLRQARVSRTCSRTTIYADSFPTELPCFAMWESLLLSLFSRVGNYSRTLLWPCKKRKYSVQSIHAPFPLPLVYVKAWPAVSFNHTWPQAVSQTPPSKSACGYGEIQGKPYLLGGLWLPRAPNGEETRLQQSPLLSASRSVAMPASVRGYRYGYTQPVRDSSTTFIAKHRINEQNTE